MLLLIILGSTNSYCQNIFILFETDSATAKRNCDVYFSGIANTKMDVVKVPTKGFYGFRCPLEKTFEVILDCWPDRIVLDKIFPKCGDSIVVNLDKRTFYYKKGK